MPYDKPDPVALAALSICEALLITLEEKDILDRNAVDELLGDAISAYENDDSSRLPKDTSARAARIVHLIMTQSNSVRSVSKVIDD